MSTSDTITELKALIAERLERAEKATPDWPTVPNEPLENTLAEHFRKAKIGLFKREADFQFAAHARTDVPEMCWALLLAVGGLEAAIREMHLTYMCANTSQFEPFCARCNAESALSAMLETLKKP